MNKRNTSCSAVIATLMVAILGTSTVAGPQSLVGSEWRPQEVAGAALPADAPLFVRFEATGKVQGHGGCNALFGSYTIDTATLRIGPLAATRKACRAPIMKRERAFMSALESARIFLRDRTKLTLKNAQGVTNVRLVQTDWD